VQILPKEIPEGSPKLVSRALKPKAWRTLLEFTRRMRPTIRRSDCPEGEGGHLTLARFLDELKVLRLYGRDFGWEEYRDRLAAHLGIEIHVRFVEDPVERMRWLGDDPGRLYRDEQTADALILISADLDGFAALKVVFHELGHVAGGHPLLQEQAVEDVTKEALGNRLQVAYPGALDEEEDSWWDPPRSILGPVAPRDEDYCEDDARLRAEYSLLAGHYGYDQDRGDESFFHPNFLSRFGRLQHIRER
jgi:hypothetical protein